MSTFELSSLDEPTFRRELLVVASFLAGYGASTRTGYATDLRLFTSWCRDCGLGLFEVQRSHLELFGRSMEARGLMPSTVARRLSALTSFYRYCEQEGHIDRSPAAHIRQPKVDNESRKRPEAPEIPQCAHRSTVLRGASPVRSALFPMGTRREPLIRCGVGVGRCHDRLRGSRRSRIGVA